MPNLRPALRAVGGRRVSGQVLAPKVVDHVVQQNAQKILRATAVLTPLTARQIAVKPEGERAWKWWRASTATKLELGSAILPDHDARILYRVMSEADYGQARIYVYDFVEQAR